MPAKRKQPSDRLYRRSKSYNLKANYGIKLKKETPGLKIRGLFVSMTV